MRAWSAEKGRIVPPTREKGLKRLAEPWFGWGKKKERQNGVCVLKKKRTKAARKRGVLTNCSEGRIPKIIDNFTGGGSLQRKDRRKT